MNEKMSTIRWESVSQSGAAYLMQHVAKNENVSGGIPVQLQEKQKTFRTTKHQEEKRIMFGTKQLQNESTRKI